MISNKKLLCFDLFHTLICSRTDGIKGIMTSEILGIPDDVWTRLVFDSSDARLRGLAHDKYAIMRDLAHQYDPSISEKVIRQAADYREEKFRRTLCEPHTDKVQILNTLKERGHKLCLVSNADSVEVGAWPQCPLANCFDQAVFSFQVGHVKPEKEIYEAALNLFDCSPEDAAFIADGSNSEFKGAKRVGLTTIMTTEIIQEIWPEKIPDRQIDADYTISSLAKLLNA